MVDIGRIGESLDVLMAVERRRVAQLDVMASILYDAAVYGEQIDQRIAAIGQALNGGDIQEQHSRVDQAPVPAGIPSYPPPPSAHDFPPASSGPAPDPSYLYNPPPGFYEATHQYASPTAAQQGPPPVPEHRLDYRLGDALRAADVERPIYGRSAPRYSGPPLNGHYTNGGR